MAAHNIAHSFHFIKFHLQLFRHSDDSVFQRAKLLPYQSIIRIKIHKELCKQNTKTQRKTFHQWYGTFHFLFHVLLARICECLSPGHIFFFFCGIMEIVYSVMQMCATANREQEKAIQSERKQAKE